MMAAEQPPFHFSLAIVSHTQTHTRARRSNTSVLWKVAVAVGEKREEEEVGEEERVLLFVAVIALNLICNGDQLVGLFAIANGVCGRTKNHKSVFKVFIS